MKWKHILIFIGALLAGAVINMLLVQLGTSIIPPPPGADVSTPEGLEKSMRLFQPKHFITPWLAHALGSLAASYAVSRWSTERKMVRALMIGSIFFLGGAYMVYEIPSTPRWFALADLAGAYFPMAWLGGRLADHPARRLDNTDSRPRANKNRSFPTTRRFDRCNRYHI